MSAELESNNVTPGSKNSLVAFFSRHFWLCALISILALEIFTFGSIQKKIGFYLDDWYTIDLLNNVHAKTGSNFFHFFRTYLVSDPRTVVRPAQVALFVSGYLVCGLKPLGYHVFNVVCEVASAFFLYLILNLLCDTPALSLVAALLLVVYPNHDASRYWATCSPETFSLVLSLASVYFNLRGARGGGIKCHAAAVICFCISIFNYETFLPLTLFNLIGSLWIYLRTNPLKASLFKVSCIAGGYVAAVGSLLFYSRVIAPKLAVAQVHPAKLDAGVMWHAIAEGFACNQPFYTVPFYWEQIGKGLQTYWSNQSLVGLLFTLVVLGALLLVGKRGVAPRKELSFLLALAAILFVSSYTIFGLNHEYVPTLMSLLNRINYGAAVAIAIFLAALIQMLAQSWKHQKAVLILVTLPILTFYALADRGLAQPWILSCYTQKAIADGIKANADKFHTDDAVLLANCPRYVMWAPVFDGVWDFQHMLRLTLKDSSMQGGVISERMVLTRDSVKDISMNVLCGDYKFGKLFVAVPPHGELYKVDSAEQFIDVIREHGFGFYLDKKILSKWRQDLADEK